MFVNICNLILSLKIHMFKMKYKIPIDYGGHLKIKGPLNVLVSYIKIHLNV